MKVGEGASELIGVMSVGDCGWVGGEVWWLTSVVCRIGVRSLSVRSRRQRLGRRPQRPPALLGQTNKLQNVSKPTNAVLHRANQELGLPGA